MPLSDRHNAILLAVLREHIKTAKAVGSEILADNYNLGLSSASVRNAMMELEERGFLAQPHTSAGRVPTTKAYRYYLDHFLQDAEVTQTAQHALRHAVQHSAHGEERMKGVAKVIADLTSNTVLVGFTPHDVYYTGISQLFHQPEFAALESILQFTEIIDRLDDVMAKLYHHVSQESQVLLGKDNPFGEDTGAIMIRCSDGVVGILGPVRMAYDQNLALLNYVHEILL